MTLVEEDYAAATEYIGMDAQLYQELCNFSPVPPGQTHSIAFEEPSKRLCCPGDTMNFSLIVTGPFMPGLLVGISVGDEPQQVLKVRNDGRCSVSNTTI